MKKSFLAIMTLMLMAIAAPKAMAMPDKELDIDAALASMNDEDRLKATVELIGAALTEEEDSPFDAIWVDEDYNAVVMSMKMDAETIDGIEAMPTMFKTLMMNEIFGDKDLVDFAHLIGKTGRELDFFFHDEKNEKKTVIEVSAEELLNVK